MALTTNTPYKSGTVSSVSGTTFTVSSSTFASGDVGRCIYMLNGDAEGQTRKIVGYISGTVVTLDHAWDDSPIDGITEDEPSNGDTFYVVLLSLTNLIMAQTLLSTTNSVTS
jgi:hypothetical protein